MAYVAVVKALYDYAPQDAETELALKEDDIAYIIEKEDDDWWKAKLKDVGGVEGAVGLVPVTYVEELPPLDTVRALYAYESTTAEELSMDEDDTCHVFSEEDDWLLVRIEGKGDTLGFVPKTYCDPIDATHGVEVADAAEGEAEVEAARAEEARHREMAERQRQLKLKDKVETWSVSEVDGRKKKKGTLGVGNGAVFFASDTDKSPVKQYPITDLQNVTQTSSKEISLAFASLTLLVHCGSSDNARAILAKLETSKEAAGEALETIEAETAASDSEEEAAPEPKAVRWAPEPSAASPAAVSPAVATRNGSSGGEKAVVLYDFDAQGDDELTVKENDSITLVDRSDDEWWLVRNSRGQEGVVPAQYVQIGGDAPSAGGDDDGYDAEEQRRHEEEEAAAAAALEAERQRERAQKAEQRRAIERAAKEKMAQEEEDRQLALDLEKREVEKQIRREQKREMDALQKREDEHRARREATRGREPPKIAKRPSANDVAAAAARLPDRGRGVPDKPDDSRPKPNSGRIRTWSDKSGQFQVDAEYLGMNGHKIRLHKINGVIIEVPLEKMSHEDAQMIKRYEARKQRQMEEDDDIPLGRTPRKNGRGDRERERSEETRARQTPPSPARKGPSPVHQQPQQQQKPRKPAFDWFAFFLEAGCGMDDCTRYAANFERDRIDESLLPDLDASTLRSLGLKEGDVLRVRKDIANKYAKKTPEQEAQIKQDEEYARQLQEYERGGGKGPIPQPPPSLFTGPSGKLANNTRRGRPDRKGTIDSVDPGAIAGLTDQLSKMNTGSSSTATAPAQSSSPPPQPPAPSIQLSPVEDKKEKEEKLIPGFDDDAWTIKPSTSKPASPAPGGTGPSSSLGGNATTPAPGSANGTDSLLAQIHALRPANTGRAGNSMSPIQQTQTGSSSGFSGPSNYGLGAQGTGQSMGAMMNYQQQQNNLVQTQSPQPTGQQHYNPNGARGPLAPVASNEALLNPMMPQQTGMFVPTRGSPAGQQQQQQQMSPMATGMMPQQTGFMMPQATGYAAGFQQGYGMQANYTGMPSTGPGQQFGQGVQQNAQNQFNNIANVPLQGQVTGMQQPQQPGGGDKFAPGNIFAAMKKSEFGKPEEQQPQNSGKYDALRPLTTGYNGGPGMMGGGMMPQQTGMMGGMMPQQTDMMMGPQQTGMYGGGMMPQMTGYNPYAGQNQYGQFR